MKNLKTILYLLLAFAAVHSHAQNWQSQISYYEENDLIDSAYQTIARYNDRFTKAQDWDSLVVLYDKEYNLSKRFKSVEETEAVMMKATNIAELHLTEADHAYHLMLLLQSDHYDFIGQSNKSLPVLDRLLAINEQHTLAKKVMNEVISDYVLNLMRSSKPKEAIELIEQHVDAVFSSKDTTAMVSLTQYHSVAHHWLLNYEKAIDLNYQNVELVKAYYGPQHPNVSIMLGQLASLYLDIGDYSQAMKYQATCREIAYREYQKNGNARVFAGTLEDLGYFYSKLGEYRLSVNNHLYALKLKIKDFGEYRPQLIWNYSQLCTSYRLLRDYNNASINLDKVANIIAANSDLPLYQSLSYRAKLAELNYHRDNYPIAFTEAEAALALFEKNTDVGDLKDRLMLYNLITNILIEQEDWTEAKRWSNKNVKAHLDNLDPYNDLVLNVLISRLDILKNFSSDKELYDLKDQIISIRNIDSTSTQMKASLPHPEYLGFVSKWSQILADRIATGQSTSEEYFDFLQEFEDYYEIHLASLKSATSITEGQRLIKDIYNPSIRMSLESDLLKAMNRVEKFRSLSNRQRLQQKLISDAFLPDVSTAYSRLLSTSDDEARLYRGISQTLDSLNQIKQKMQQEDPLLFSKYFGFQELTRADIHRLTDDDELLINCVQLDSQLIIFYISNDSEKVNVLPAKMVEETIAKEQESRTSDRTSELAAMIFDPAFVGDHNQFLILPDGVLSSVNFEQLHRDGKPLIYDYRIRYGHSLFILKYQNELSQREYKSDLLGLTPGFTSEMKTKILEAETDSSIQQYLQQPFMLSLAAALDSEFRGKSYTYEEATESNFARSDFQIKILHLGTHGVLDQDSPLSSKLVLVKDSLQDGYLHAYEIYGKTIDAELAVLSACSSGKDQINASEGAISLARAFTHAGCPSVLLTLWDVDEKSTADILSRFYSKLESGQRKSEALRNAKLDFLQDAPYQYQDPYYWAGLVLIGNDDPLFEAANKWTIILVVSSLMALILLYRRLKKRPSKTND